LCAQGIVTQRKHDVRLEAADYIVHTLQIVEIDLVDFAKIDVAGEPLRTQILDVLLGGERAGSLQPIASHADLVRGELRSEAENLGRIQFLALLRAEKDR
jgi:hypothetical protein